MEFTSYPAEQLKIDSLASRLTDSERLIRKGIMNGIIDTGKPISQAFIHGLCTKEGLDSSVIISGLLNKKVIVKNSDGDVAFVYPVSALPTPQKVTLEDGRAFHAMCAVDALGAAFTFNQNTTISSVCGQSGDPVNAKVQDGELTCEPEETHVLHVDLNKVDNWSGSC